MPWSFDQTTPIYLQIAIRLREMIVCGTFPPGEKLPSVRELSFMASANPNTVQRAFSILEDEGLAITEGTHGRRVTSDPAVVENARHAMLTELVNDFAARLSSLGCSPEEGARMIQSFTPSPDPTSDPTAP